MNMNTLRLFRNNLSAFLKRHDLNSNKVRPLPHYCIHFGAISSLHTSNICRNSPRIGEITEYETPPPRNKYNKPVDWLPFPWHRRPRFNLYTQGGDTIKENIADLSLPKPDFELSDELKNADERVKQLFSLRTGSVGEMREVCKRHLLKRIQRHPNDFDSLEVKIALQTIRIRSLFQHKEKYGKYDALNSRIILPIIIQKRNKLLKQLREMDNDRYLWVLDELKLFYKPHPVVEKLDKYCKKWDLRRLTKEHCQKVVADKKAAYHEELKKQQADFLEEKKQILAWIEEEEKALNVKQ